MKGFFAALADALPREHPATVLEVGVGEGEISAKLRSLYPDAHIVGVDLHDDALAAGWPTRGFVGVFADIARLPFPPLAFELVMAIEVLEHVHEPPVALAELLRVSRGRLVLSVPREPIWRVANMARGKYLADLGNTPGPHPALVTAQLRRARGVTARGGEREHAISVDDDRGATGRRPPQRQRSVRAAPAIPVMPARQR